MGHTVTLPAFRYFMVTWGISAEFGGMTTMCLTRARTMRRLAGVHAPVLTFDIQPDYDLILDFLMERGHLIAGMEILNIYSYYRHLDLQDRPTAEGIRPPGDGIPSSDTQTQTILDGQERVFCQVTRSLDAETVYSRNFLRPDGSTFLLDEVGVADTAHHAGKQPRVFSLLDTDGRVVCQYGGNHDFYRAWMTELAEEEKSVFIADSIQTTGFVSDLELTTAMKFVVIHNSHIAGGGDPVRGKVSPARRDVVDNSSSWNGLIFLTEQQRQDFIGRFGSADNLFQLGNPRPRAEMQPDPAQREPARGVMVCRLETVKNVRAAIDIVELASRSLPEIRLDIYGDGELRRELQQRIDELGMGGQIRMHGHVTHAAAEFETAAFSLLTSTMEGLPLALLESLGRGCPPVCYDIRYGPSDLVQDGVNGFVVPSGDVNAAATRVVQLCTDRDTAARISRACWEKAGEFSEESVLEGLGSIVNTAWNQRGERLRLTHVAFGQERLAVLTDGQLEIAGSVTFDQEYGPAAEDVLSVSLQLVPRKSGPPSLFPGKVMSRAPGAVEVVLTADTAAMGAEVSGDDVLDAFVLVSGNNVLHRERIPFGSGKGPWVPDATITGELSLKPTRLS